MEELIEAATQILEQALVLMREQKVPVTAENLMVWYHYVEGDKPRLNAEVDKLLARQVRFNETLNGQLYQRFFVEMDRRKVDLLQAAIRKLIDSFASYVESLGVELDDYQVVLRDCADTLQGDCDAEQLLSLVQNTLERTTHAMEASRTARSHIDALNHEIALLRTSLSELERSALEDSLTAVANRRAFDQYYPQLLEKYKNSVEGCCLLLVDVDRFKSFNDKYGHQVGDRVLRFVAAMLKNVSKGQDVVARYGGEEFAVVLPATGYRGGIALAQQMCKAIATARLTIDAKNEVIDSVTVSIGVSWSRPTDSPELLLRRADKCLMQAKQQGRNRVMGQNDLDA